LDTQPRRDLKLLVVEDEAVISMDLECILEDLGHRVLGAAASVDRALELVNRFSADADGAVLDVNLGGTSSVPVAEALRARGVPFVVASGYERAELEQLGFVEKGVSKPYSATEIEHALRLLPQR
jgi:CheY-like chemotaxis protein